MNRVLAVDTSCLWGGVALAERAADGRIEVVAELGVASGGAHAARLIGWIDGVLGAAGRRRDAVDGYVATRGPGSFTGLRIGLGTVRGLALAADKPCGGVVTLEAMAEAAGWGHRPRAPLIDAGRGELFHARYAPAGSPPPQLDAPAVSPPDEALAACDGARVLPAADERTFAALRKAGFEPPPPVRGVAAAAARLALLDPERTFVEAALEPLYLRASDAELNLRRR